ncbi:uncharacterized protein LOC135691020 [Rhopilema esculentum]|uniref:uncharacterized protein LOC135691020 n=1 Tax=Rhopilema esculentum TaxID=499914 RepID=UPI0031DBA349|eukprot:gene1252-15630_t
MAQEMYDTQPSKMKQVSLSFFIAFSLVNSLTALNLQRSLTELLKVGKELGIDFCKDLGYQDTGKINFLKEINQTKVAQGYLFKAFEALDRTNCSKLVRPLACSLLAPPLLDRFGSIPPCRSMCLAVEKSCAAVLKFAASLGALAQGGCKTTVDGRDFRGTVNKTVGGHTCQHWNVHKPHSHRQLTAKTHPWEGLEENYCRNPDGEPDGPWCYTTSKSVRWDYCDVPTCFTSLWCKMLPNPSKTSGCLNFKFDPKLHKYTAVVEGTPNVSQAKSWNLPFN